MTLIAVFGAGASYDVAQSETAFRRGVHTPGFGLIGSGDGRPPLTKDLFARGALVDRLVTRYPDCASLIHEAREALRDGSELTLESFLADCAQRTQPADQRAVRAVQFFLRDLLWAVTEATLDEQRCGPVTNYVGLVAALDRWAREEGESLCLVTFDYDLLLEHACQLRWGFNPTSLSDYIADPDRLLMKPHGSVNWAYPLMVPTAAGVDRPVGRGHVDAALAALRLTEAAQRTEIELQATFQTTSAVGLQSPALALPIQGKAAYVCPDDHIDAMFRNVRGRIRLLTVGWRGAEPYFVEMLGKLFRNANQGPPKALLVTGGPAAEADGETLRAIVEPTMPWDGNRDELVTVRTDGFSGLTSSAELRDFLN